MELSSRTYLLAGVVLLGLGALALAGWLLTHAIVPVMLLIVGLLCIIFAQIMLYRRIQQRTSLVHHEIHEIHQQMHQMHQETYAQFQATRQAQQEIALSFDEKQEQTDALISLSALIRLNTALPPTKNAAARPDLLKHIVATIYKYKPQRILELGSGVSTIIAAYSLENLGQGTIISFDQDATYTTISQEQILDHGLEAITQIIHAPLREIDIQGQQWLWYDLQAFKTIETIDLLIIDGPVGTTQPLARYPALPLLWNYLHAHSIIILDDGKRPDEQKIVELWLSEFAGLSAEYIATEKGAYILRCNGVSAFLHHNAALRANT